MSDDFWRNFTCSVILSIYYYFSSRWDKKRRAECLKKEHEQEKRRFEKELEKREREDYEKNQNKRAKFFISQEVYSEIFRKETAK